MPRCFGYGDPLYEAYHDSEWGVPVHGERELYERVSLEAFQSGLAWITILRKRPAFRAAFAGFEPERVARFTDDDVARLLADAGIVRNRAKIEATIANAHAVLGLWERDETLSGLFWSHAPAAPSGAVGAAAGPSGATSPSFSATHADREPLRRRPLTWADVPSQTDESRALAKSLKAAGFRFVGPTITYAAMQACGLVDDHLAGCSSVVASAPGPGSVVASAPGPGSIVVAPGQHPDEAVSPFGTNP